MVSARITRILYALFLLILSVVLLAEANFFFVVGFSFLVQAIQTIVVPYIALIVLAIILAIILATPLAIFYRTAPRLFRVALLGSKIVYGSIQWGYRQLGSYWAYAGQKKAREVTVVFLFAFITVLASLMRIQLPTVVYYAFFLFVVGYTASVALFPEIRTLDKLWLSLGMSLTLLILIPLILSMAAPMRYTPLTSTSQIVTLVTATILFAVLLKRLATT